MSAGAAGLGFGERLAEVAGPIVVKEVRQGLRARVFAIFFGLLLVGCLVVALIAAVEFDRAPSVDLGPEYFRLFLVALALVEYFVIPYLAFRAMAREREDETWVLLTLTGLGPRRIVRGKVSSALAQGLLYASACAPFVLFSYYLNGIDLPTVLTALALALSWSVLLVCFAVAVATQAHSRPGRALAHFLVLGVLLGATAAGAAFSVFFSRDAGRLLREDAGFRGFCVALAVWALTTGALLSEGAASGLALPSENAARGPRLALAAQVLLAVAAVGAALWWYDGADAKVAMVASVATSLQLAVCGLFAASEHDGWPPAFGAVRGWQRPGAVRSFGLLLGLLGLATAAWASCYLLLGHHARDKHFRVLLVGPLYVVLYLSLGVLLGRLSWLRRLGEPVATRAGCGAAVALGTFGPMFAAVLAGHDPFHKGSNITNPLLGLAGVNGGGRGEATLLVVGTAALLAGFLALVTLAARDGVRRW